MRPDEPEMDWIVALLDGLPALVAVVGPHGRPSFANRPALDALAALGRRPDRPLCRTVLDVVEAVRRDGKEIRNVAIEPSSNGPRWRGRFWPIGDDRVALYLTREARRTTGLARVVTGLGVEPAQARLAVAITEGRTNPEIAQVLEVPLTTINGRVSLLLRKLGLRRRIEVATRVLECLMKEESAAPEGWVR
jgi:DNA-binding CsgD family transcriptional regulator